MLLGSESHSEMCALSPAMLEEKRQTKVASSKPGPSGHSAAFRAGVSSTEGSLSYFV